MPYRVFSSHARAPIGTGRNQRDSPRAEKRRRAALAAGMLLVPFITFGAVLGLFLITTY